MREPIRGWELVALIAVLIAAMSLRVWRLDSVPPGLTHDEANNVADAASILQGERPFYFPVAQGKEPLYPYSAALVMAFLGSTPLALRVTSVVWGGGLVILTYAWARRTFGGTVAVWTAIGLAMSFWGISTSRLGLRAVTFPVSLTAAVLLLPLSEAGRRDSLVPSIIGGVFLGLTFYTYLAARALPGLFLLFAVYLLLFHRARWREVWRQWLTALLVAAVVAAPLLLYLRAHPSASIRLGQLDRPLRALLRGDPGPLLGTVLSSLRVFSFQGDGFVPYNIPGRPILSPLLSVFFYGGLLIGLQRWREPAYAFALLWLAVGFFPALVTGLDAANLRAIGAQPVTFLFPALTMRELWDAASARLTGTRLALVGVGGSLVFGSAAFLATRDYFVRWPARQDVRVHYHADLRAVAERLQSWGSELPTAISTAYPGEYHDPRIVEAYAADRNVSPRWFDGRQALVLPASGRGLDADPTFSSGTRLILPAALPLDTSLWDVVRPQATLFRRVKLRPNDFNPSFAVYDWMPAETRDTLTAMLEQPAASEGLPVTVGGELRFQGYQLQGWIGEAGSEFRLLTLWDILASLPEDRDAVLFSQLLDSDQRVVAQHDELGAPSWNWHRGDAFLQLHRLSVPEDAPAGEYVLMTGVYTTPDRVDAVLAGKEPDLSMPRLPVRRDGEPWSDAIRLVALEVE